MLRPAGHPPRLKTVQCHSAAAVSGVRDRVIVLSVRAGKIKNTLRPEFVPRS